MEAVDIGAAVIRVFTGTTITDITTAVITDAGTGVSGAAEFGSARAITLRDIGSGFPAKVGSGWKIKICKR